MFWAIFFCSIALLPLALASVSLRGRLRGCAPHLFNICNGSPARRRPSDLSKMHKPNAHVTNGNLATDGWRILELWRVAEQRRSFTVSRSDTDLDDGSPASESNIGLPESIALSRSDFRLPFTKGSAAVLVCLFQTTDNEIRVILTKRAQALSSHSGEVALPGGKRDKEDANDAATALREAKEEIGLDPSLVKVVTTVEPFVAKQLPRVTPVIALLMDRTKFTPAPNPGEVDAIFDAPLDMFLKDERHRFEVRKWFGYSYHLHFFDHEVNNQRFLIWGLTAAILIRCASVIYQRSPAFEEVHGDPANAVPRL